jgi:hypothetical protein
VTKSSSSKQLKLIDGLLPLLRQNGVLRLNYTRGVLQLLDPLLLVGAASSGCLAILRQVSLPFGFG